MVRALARALRYPQALVLSSQFSFCLAEIAAAMLQTGAAKRVVAARQLLSSAVARIPHGKDLAGGIANGDSNLGVLWANHYTLLLSLTASCVPASTQLVHPNADEVGCVSIGTDKGIGIGITVRIGIWICISKTST